jgi:broad specificity phosphatase PhoE
VRNLGDGRLTFVRHAMPVPDPDTPADRWSLSADGRVAAAALARAYQPELPVYLVASDEPKAAETLTAMFPGVPVARDAGLGEVRRPRVWQPDHRMLARSYVEGDPPEGWEPRPEVVDRFDAAVARHASMASGRRPVFGTHGMALTVWLADRVRLDPDPAAFWAALRFPDLITFDPIRSAVSVLR